MILADPSMQGRETAVRHLMEVDSESPWPPDYHLDFTTLWCRSASWLSTPNNMLPYRQQPMFDTV